MNLNYQKHPEPCQFGKVSVTSGGGFISPCTCPKSPQKTVSDILNDALKKGLEAPLHIPFGKDELIFTQPKDCPLNCDCPDHNELAMPQSEGWDKKRQTLIAYKEKGFPFLDLIDSAYLAGLDSSRQAIAQAELKGHALARASAVVEIDEAYQRGLKEAGLNCKLDHDTAYERGKAEQFAKDCAEDEDWGKEILEAIGKAKYMREGHEVVDISDLEKIIKKVTKKE